MTIDEMIAVLHAAKQGKKIQYRYNGVSSTDGWHTAVTNAALRWEFSTYEYRVAPEPREIWVRECLDGQLSSSNHLSEDFVNRSGERAILFREVID